MIDDRLKNMYDDLFSPSGNRPGKDETDMIEKKLSEIFDVSGGSQPGPADGAPSGNGTGSADPGGQPGPEQGRVQSGQPGPEQGGDSGAGQAGSQSGQPEQQQQAEQEAAEAEPETDPMEELDALIGLQAIKHDVKELIAFVKVQKLREESGLKSAPVSLHLVFTGNPGTGKTTVARIIARLYKQIGVLSKGQLVEVDRSGLVAGYVGQTALKTQKKIEEAMGGILFIDEAYALAKEGNDFGQEAVDTVLKAMEDNRSDFVVIVAGYTEPMEQFIESNPGLKSRFNKYIEFADYTMEELTAIFKSFCDKYDYMIDEENLARVTDLLRIKRTETLENFANAREVRNLFERIITNQARRVNEMENPSLEDMRTLIYEDLFDDGAEGTKNETKIDEAPAAEVSEGSENVEDTDDSEDMADVDEQQPEEK